MLNQETIDKILAEMERRSHRTWDEQVQSWIDRGVMDKDGNCLIRMPFLDLPDEPGPVERMAEVAKGIPDAQVDASHVPPPVKH